MLFRSGETRAESWWVHNGTRLLGPLSVAEIVRLLLAQELDFDCDCRSGGGAESTPLAQARIFGDATPDEEHRYWLFDGKQLHGPLSAAFLTNSHSRGWIEPGSVLCESSTINGWQAIDRWIEGQPLESAVTESPAEPLDPGSTAA